jgi:hypothetical protein
VRSVLERSEVGPTGTVEGDHLAVDQDVAPARCVVKGVKFREPGGHVGAASAGDAHTVSGQVSDATVAVPLGLERPARLGGKIGDRDGQHRPQATRR